MVTSALATILTIGLAAIAAVASAWAAVSSHRQVRFDQDAAGGRGILFDVKKDTQAIVGGERQANYTVRLELFGPGARYQAELCLLRAGAYYVTQLGKNLIREEGTPAGPMKQTWKVMRCDDEPVRWDFSVVPANAVSEDIWCMFTWTDPRGEALWTGAYARRLTQPDVLYEWHPYKTRNVRKRIQRWGAAERKKQRVWHRYAAEPRPLGRWRVHRDVGLLDRQGPALNLDNIP